jgi:hypothetical protein
MLHEKFERTWAVDLLWRKQTKLSFYVRNRGMGGLAAECSKPAAKRRIGSKVNGRRDRKASRLGGRVARQPEECCTEVMVLLAD